MKFYGRTGKIQKLEKEVSADEIDVLDKLMKIMDSEVFYEKYIAKDFEENFASRQFKEICKQYLIRKNRAGKKEPVIEKLGKYYYYDDPVNHTNGKFDIVTMDEKGYVFYEVKFKKVLYPKKQ